MAKKKDNRGGKRAGAGRPKSGRDVQLRICLSKIAVQIMKDKNVRSKSAYIDNLIIQSK